MASGDNARLARAFQAMSKAPPGMGGWAAICAQGAALANAGDFDAAKAQCKVCHGKYQSAYKASMRDMPWPLRVHGAEARVAAQHGDASGELAEPREGARDGGVFAVALHVDHEDVLPRSGPARP